MAAELFPAFSDFKPYVGGRINQSVRLESLEATIYETARRHITPWLTDTLYNRLVAGASLTSAEMALLPYVRRPLALLSIFEYSKVAAIEFGESGMHRIESDTRKSAYRYQERAYKDDALEKGYDALEVMLRHLDTNKATFTDWAASDEGLVHRTPLLNYASDFRLLALPECDRYTFECIRPIISEVETFAVKKILPATFWSGFQTRHLAGTLTSAEKVLRKYMRQSIAHRAIEEAIKSRWIRIDGGRIAIHEDFGDQRNTNMTMPSTTGGSLYVNHMTWSDRFNALWVEYIRANSVSFATVFDVASGGSNSATDAWHINTTTEQTEADCLLITEKKKPIYRF